MRHLPPDAAFHRADEPVLGLSIAEQLVARTGDLIQEVTYVLAMVNSDKQSAKRMRAPEPLLDSMRPRRHGRRERRGDPIPAEQLGGEVIEVEGVENA